MQKLEWNFGSELELKVIKLQCKSFIPHLISLLKQRCHDKPCDLQWLIEMEDKEAASKKAPKILEVLEEITREEQEQE
jgi:hypothetical protein